MFTGSILTKVLIGAVLVLALILGLTRFQLHSAEKQVSTLQENNAILKANNTTLKFNLEEAAKANQSTVEANKKLLEERKDAQALIAELAKQKQVSQANLADANKKIDEMLKDPRNNGTIAPVLRETLKDIQKRKKK